MGKNFGFLTGFFFTGFLLLFIVFFGEVFLGGFRDLNEEITRSTGFLRFVFADFLL
jgi:hypothetical protein